MDERGGEVPGASDTVGIKPVGDGFRAVTARQVVEFGRRAFRSFLGGVEEGLPMFGSETFAEVAEKGLNFVGGFLQVSGRPARCRSRIVQLVGQSSRHSAKGNELFPLLGV